jgi:hypothetical protein
MLTIFMAGCYLQNTEVRTITMQRRTIFHAVFPKRRDENP